MVRKILDFLNPTRRLPAPMRRYLRLPNRLFLGWLALTVLVPAVLVQMNAWGLVDLRSSQPSAGIEAQPFEREQETPALDAESEELPPIAAESAPAPDSGAYLDDSQAGSALADGASIVVTGSSPFTLRRSGGRILVEVPGQAALTLADVGDDHRLLDAAGNLVYRLKVKDAEKGKLYDGRGVFRLRVKCEKEQGEESCKLYDPAGKRVQRVKIKSDSFNVYGAGEERLYKGKLKGGAYVLRDEARNTHATVAGVSGLKEAALLSLPVDVPVRILLWRYAGR